jgi:hypothetical protein
MSDYDDRPMEPARITINPNPTGNGPRGSYTPPRPRADHPMKDGMSAPSEWFRGWEPPPTEPLPTQPPASEPPETPELPPAATGQAADCKGAGGDYAGVDEVPGGKPPSSHGGRNTP